MFWTYRSAETVSSCRFEKSRLWATVVSTLPTGGIDPLLWRPIPGVQTLNFLPYRVDLTPFAGALSNGQPHQVGVRLLKIQDRPAPPRRARALAALSIELRKRWNVRMVYGITA